ncbi:MAG TPA: RNA polymerase sigma factor [Chitinophagaceae bacterium]
MTESALIGLLRKGDETAFKEIVTTWQDMVFNTVLGILQNEEDAEDVAQEVFVQVFESISSFKEESKLSTWLYRIAVTKSLDHLRRKKRKKRFAFVQSLFGMNHEEKNLVTDFYHPGVALDNKERAAVLFKAINNLPPNQKVAFTLHKVEGLSYQEISEAMQTSLSAVESLIHRAKGNLKNQLNIYYQNHK